MKKHSIFLLLVLLFGSLVLPFSAMAENNDTKPQSNSETTILKEDFENENQPENVAIQIDSTIIEDVDNLLIDYFPKKPEFPGGLKALRKYLDENIHYPRQAAEVGAQGVVHVRFTVNVDGSVTDVEIVRSSQNEYLDNEALRLVKDMPKWIPGENNGHVIQAKAQIPVRFHLVDIDGK